MHARIAHALDSVPRGPLAPAERASTSPTTGWPPVRCTRRGPAAAAAAAAKARRDFANVEAADLPVALDAHALDPAGHREERYELLLSFCEAAAWAARWRPVVEAVVEAVALAQRRRRPRSGSRAQRPLTRYSVWLPAGALRGPRGPRRRPAFGAPRLDHHDSPVRCVLMLALAVQLYYAPGADRRCSRSSTRAWPPPDASTTRPARLGGAAPRGWPCGGSSTSPADRPRRARVAAARESGDEAALAVGHIALARHRGGGGRPRDLAGRVGAAEAIARRRRLVYVEFVLHFVRLNLTLLADDDEAADAHADAMRTMSDGIATPALEWIDFGVSYVAAMSRPEVAAAVASRCSPAPPEPVGLGPSPLLHVLALAGRPNDVRPESPVARSRR